MMQGRPTVTSPARRGHHRRRGASACLLLVAALAGGCSGGADGGAGTGAPPPLDAPDDAGDDAPDTGTGGTVEAGLEDAIALAVADAAASAGIAETSVTVVSAEFVTWPDGALGCPEPGMVYTEALVDGYRIVLEVADLPVAYHGALDAPPFRCTDRRPPVG